jgi:hypothetical protein
MKPSRRKKVIQARLLRVDGGRVIPGRKWEGGRLKGVGPEIQAVLAAFGYYTLDDLRAATDKELLAVSGIGGRLLARIRAQLSNVTTTANSR